MTREEIKDILFRLWEDGKNNKDFNKSSFAIVELFHTKEKLAEKNKEELSRFKNPGV